MTQNDMAEIRNEGDIAFPDTEKDNSAASPADETTTEETQAADGDSKNKQQDPDKDIPFHDHPRWKQRETEWNERFNQQETRHQEDMKKIREDFGADRKKNAEQTEIPSWFGGSKEQWEAYRADEDKKLVAAEERAIKRITEAKTSEEKAVADATAYMQAEMSAIEGDKTLNPTGAKIDPNKLLKAVLDNDLVDSQGRWNYRAGWRILQREAANVTPPKPNNDRKKVAEATTSESRTETKPPAFKTSADFKRNKPW